MDKRGNADVVIARPAPPAGGECSARTVTRPPASVYNPSMLELLLQPYHELSAQGLAELPGYGGAFLLTVVPYLLATWLARRLLRGMMPREVAGLMLYAYLFGTAYPAWPASTQYG